MDETDKRLLKLLLENGVMHTVELAAALGVSEDEIVSRMMPSTRGHNRLQFPVTAVIAAQGRGAT